MRKKELKLVITFHTTSDAMAAEKICKEHEDAGRLIPVPRSLSAGCGLAWCTGAAMRGKLEALFLEAGIFAEGFHEIMV